MIYSQAQIPKLERFLSVHWKSLTVGMMLMSLCILSIGSQPGSLRRRMPGRLIADERWNRASRDESTESAEKNRKGRENPRLSSNGTGTAERSWNLKFTDGLVLPRGWRKHRDQNRYYYESPDGKVTWGHPGDTERCALKIVAPVDADESYKKFAGERSNSWWFEGKEKGKYFRYNLRTMQARESYKIERYYGDSWVLTAADGKKKLFTKKNYRSGGKQKTKWIHEVGGKKVLTLYSFQIPLEATPDTKYLIISLCSGLDAYLMEYKWPVDLCDQFLYDVAHVKTGSEIAKKWSEKMYDPQGTNGEYTVFEKFLNSQNCKDWRRKNRLILVRQ